MITRKEYEEAVNGWATLVKNGSSNDDMISYFAARINQFEYEQERAAQAAPQAKPNVTVVATNSKLQPRWIVECAACAVSHSYSKETDAILAREKHLSRMHTGSRKPVNARAWFYGQSFNGGTR